MGGVSGERWKNKEECEEMERTFGKDMMRDCKEQQDVSSHLACLGTGKTWGHIEFLKGSTTSTPKSLIFHPKRTDSQEWCVFQWEKTAEDN